MKTIKIFVYMAACTLFLTSCVKDLQDDINDGDWNHERSVLKIEFENQIGAATIENNDGQSGDIELSINVGAQPSMASVKLTALEISYDAKATAKVGDALDFSDGVATIDVTSALGETRTYTITANAFRETIEGTYQITDLTIYGGTGPEYGGGAVMRLMDKSWCWYDNYAPSTECDNTLTFTMTGVDDNGNTMGTCTNDAGADGKYADFIFKGSMNKEGTDDIDLKAFYRQIPEGESTWVRNYSEGTISFTDKEGRVTEGKLVESGTIDCGYGNSFSVTNEAFQFSLNGTDDWTNIYSDYDKFVKKPRIYWISVTKE